MQLKAVAILASAILVQIMVRERKVKTCEASPGVKFGDNPEVSFLAMAA